MSKNVERYTLDWKSDEPAFVAKRAYRWAQLREALERQLSTIKKGRDPEWLVVTVSDENDIRKAISAMYNHLSVRKLLNEFRIRTERAADNPLQLWVRIQRK